MLAESKLKSVFLMNESVEFSSFENGFWVSLVCLQNESVYGRTVSPFSLFMFCHLALTIFWPMNMAFLRFFRANMIRRLFHFSRQKVTAFLSFFPPDDRCPLHFFSAYRMTFICSRALSMAPWNQAYRMAISYGFPA